LTIVKTCYCLEKENKEKGQKERKEKEVREEKESS